MKAKTKIIFGSAMTAAMCASLIAGSTFALFTSEAKTNIAITSGSVKVTAAVNSLQAWYSLPDGEGGYAYTAGKVTEDKGTYSGIFGTDDFYYGGLAYDAESGLTLTDLIPGDKVEFTLAVENKSTVAVRYQMQLVNTTEGVSAELLGALNVTVDGKAADFSGGRTIASAWSKPITGDIPDVSVTIELPIGADNSAMEKDGEALSCSLELTLYAVQGNANVTEAPDPDDPDAANTTCIYNLLELKDFRDAVNGGDTFYDGASDVRKTVMLMGDISLKGEDWTPIGGTDGASFNGRFIGNGHTVSDLTVTKHADGTSDDLGLFGSVSEGGSVEGLKLYNVTVKGGSRLGAVAGYAFTAEKFANISVGGKIEIEGNYMLGGIAGGGYGKFLSCIVKGEGDSHITATYLAADTEGDNVGGIVGFTGEHNLNGDETEIYIDHCKAEGLALAGTRKVGGIAGFLHENTGLANCTVSALTVKCNAPLEYMKSDGYRLAVGGLIGETNVGTVIRDNTLSDIAIDAFATFKYDRSTGHDVPTEFTLHTKEDAVLDPEVVGNFRDGHLYASAIKINTVSYTGNTMQNVTTTACFKNVTWAWYNGGNLGVYPVGSEIGSAEELRTFAKTGIEVLNDAGTKYLRIKTEYYYKVVLTAEEYDLGGEIWEPIKTMDLHIVGNGTVIKNMDTGEGRPQAGFFSSTSRTAIEDVTFMNATVKGEQAGVVTGHSEGKLILKNVQLAGKISVSYREIDGQYPGLGFYVGAWGASTGSSFEGCKIAADAEATLDITGLVSSKGYNGISDGYMIGYFYGGEAKPTVLPTADETAKVAVMNGGHNELEG